MCVDLGGRRIIKKKKLIFFFFFFFFFLFFFVFFFFKQKTAYEIHSGDWSSDVCSSDLLNGQQLKFANVIVQNTKWTTLDAKGYLYFQNIDNTEDGYYFTKGKCIHVTWQKTGDYAPTVYYDDLGNEIQLNEGKTYIAVAQKGRPVAFN